MAQFSMITINLQGRIDANNYKVHMQKIAEVIASSSEQVVVDLSEVPFLDCFGLGVLIKGWKLSQQKHNSFRVSGVNHEVVKTVFQVTHIDRLFPVEYTSIHK